MLWSSSGRKKHHMTKKVAAVTKNLILHDSLTINTLITISQVTLIPPHYIAIAYLILITILDFRTVINTKLPNIS